jgi:hypothetical protein
MCVHFCTGTGTSVPATGIFHDPSAYCHSCVCACFLNVCFTCALFVSQPLVQLLCVAQARCNGITQGQDTPRVEVVKADIQENGSRLCIVLVEALASVHHDAHLIRTDNGAIPLLFLMDAVDLAILQPLLSRSIWNLSKLRT